MSWEDQLKLAETILSGEFKSPVVKNNGAGQNFVEGSPFNGDRANSYSPGYITVTETGETSETIKKKKLMVESVAAGMGISKAEARGVLGLPAKQPKGRKDLTEGQKKEFDFARMIGISEADAFKLVELTGGYK
jgi:hypothetical protein